MLSKLFICTVLWYDDDEINLAMLKLISQEL